MNSTPDDGADILTDIRQVRFAMSTSARLGRVGNSLIVRIPAAIARDLDLREGQVVQVERSDDGLLVRPGELSLEERLATVHGYTDGELDTGYARGNEIFE